MSAEIEESIGRAVELMQAGRFGEADALFTEVLAGAPEQPDALHFAGLSRHAQGDLEGAISLLERATAAAPAHADAFNNLGSIYLQAGRAEDAERAFRAVLALQPESAAACFNLGVFLSRANRLEDAIPLLERAAKLEPSDPNAHERLGDARAKHRDFEAARAAYRQTRALGGGSKELLRKLGRVYFYLVDDADRRLVDREKTLAWLDEWLEIAPDDPIAKHTRAAYSGAAVPERASDDYVRATFDQFADSFDQVLANLEYKGPELCARAAQAAVGDFPSAELALLDAGCGTGLVGPLVRPWVARLVGVDLSAKMIEKARERRVYDQLVEAEMGAYLAKHAASFDVVVCADLLTYFGDLAPLAKGLARALKPGGVLVATVEPARGEDAGDFVLHRHGRYAHAATYVRATLEGAGLAVEREKQIEALRREIGVAVPGLLVTARKPE